MACSGGGDDATASSGEPTQAASVAIAGNQFDPGTTDVAAGESVTWTNDDSVAHTVTFSEDSVESSDELAAGDEFSASFDAPGTFDYVCSIHADMTGTVTVE